MQVQLDLQGATKAKAKASAEAASVRIMHLEEELQAQVNLQSAIEVGDMGQIQAAKSRKETRFRIVSFFEPYT